MISVGEVVERIQSLYSKGVKSDDTRLSSRHIYSVAKTIRGYLLTNQINKGQIVSDWNYTVLSCIKMVPVSSIQCKCFSHLGCTIYRSEKKLPKILNSLDRHIIEWVMKLDNSYIIEPTTRSEALYNNGNKYTKKRLKYVIEKGYLYINSQSSPGMIAMKAMYTDPVEAEKFNEESCGDTVESCLSVKEKDFQLDEDLIRPLIQLASEELIQIFSKMREDKTNDSSDSVKQNSK